MNRRPLHLSVIATCLFNAALLVSLIVAGPVLADTRALAEIPLPADAISHAISSNVVQNGLSTSVVALASQHSVEDTLEFYRQLWPADDDSPGHVEESVGGWRVLSHLRGETLSVVQIRDADAGSEGFISALSPSHTNAVVLPPPPMPAGGQLLSSLPTRDAGQVALTSVVSSTARPGEVAAFYRDRYRREGWQLSSERRDTDSPVLFFDREGARLEVVIASVDGRSIVIVNEVHRDA